MIQNRVFGNIAKCSTDPKVLDVLSKNDDRGVRLAVAGNMHDDIGTLNRLETDGDAKVRDAAKNTYVKKYRRTIHTNPVIVD